MAVANVNGLLSPLADAKIAISDRGFLLNYIDAATNNSISGFMGISNEDKILKVGLLAPLSGKYAELGNSLLYSLQLALEEIDDKNLSIIPRDAGFDNEEKLEMTSMQ